MLELLKAVPDPRHKSYITYSGHVMLMWRILSAVLYISSMRKASEEFNCETAIHNFGCFCGEELNEIPYWETVNHYLKRVDPESLQKTVVALVRRLLRSRAFQDIRVRGKYWQIIIDGTQLCSTRRELDHSLHRVHNRGKEDEYTEYYRYVLEAKLVLRSNVVVSIMSEFVENSETEVEKQDCERKAAKRLIKRLKEAFPHLPIILCADSLYACAPFFEQCAKYGWKYLVNFQEGSIPSIASEYKALKQWEENRRESTVDGISYWFDYVSDIDYQGYRLNVIERGVVSTGSSCHILTNLPVTQRNVMETVRRARWRWKIENEGFNAQKNHGYSLGHIFCYDGNAFKNHYYLIQIGHMIAQIMEAWTSLWNGVKISLEQKHRRILESWKTDLLCVLQLERAPPFQIRFS